MIDENLGEIYAHRIAEWEFCAFLACLSDSAALWSIISKKCVTNPHETHAPPGCKTKTVGFTRLYLDITRKRLIGIKQLTASEQAFVKVHYQIHLEVLVTWSYPAFPRSHYTKMEVRQVSLQPDPSFGLLWFRIWCGFGNSRRRLSPLLDTVLAAGHGATSMASIRSLMKRIPISSSFISTSGPGCENQHFCE